MSAKKTDTSQLPPTAQKRLAPFIERGIANGIFKDPTPVVAMFNNKANDPTLKETVDSLGGLASEVAQAFLTDIVLTDLTYEVMDISDLEDDVSRGRNDYRLIEATVSYAGVQNSRAGNQFGKLLLKDESTMTLDAIESGESLMLNALCSTDIATRFGKYSKILALITTKVQPEYGLSANIVVALPVILVAPVEATVAPTESKEDDAADYFSKQSAQAINLDDDDDDENDDSDAPVATESVDATPTPSEPKEAPQTASDEADDDDDDEDDIDLNALPVKVLKTMAKAAGVEGFSSMKKADLVAALSDDDDDAEPAPATDAADDFVDGEDDEWDDWD
jgi:hypothetical protein